jgi:uncharacterized phage protein (TIGR02216 family)
VSASFAAAARRLAGAAGAVLGWTPDAFWRATPAELAAVVAAVSGDEAGGQAPPEPVTIARMREAYPDG